MNAGTPYYRLSRPAARAQVKDALEAMLRAFQPLLCGALEDQEGSARCLQEPLKEAR